MPTHRPVVCLLWSFRNQAGQYRGCDSVVLVVLRVCRVYQLFSAIQHGRVLSGMHSTPSLTPQLAKVLTTPFIVLLQSLFYNTTFTWPIKLSLVSFLGLLLFANICVFVCVLLTSAPNLCWRCPGLKCGCLDEHHWAHLCWCWHCGDFVLPNCKTFITSIVHFQCEPICLLVYMVYSSDWILSRSLFGVRS